MSARLIGNKENYKQKIMDDSNLLQCIQHLLDENDAKQQIISKQILSIHQDLMENASTTAAITAAAATKESLLTQLGHNGLGAGTPNFAVNGQSIVNYNERIAEEILQIMRPNTNTTTTTNVIEFRKQTTTQRALRTLTNQAPPQLDFRDMPPAAKQSKIEQNNLASPLFSTTQTTSTNSKLLLKSSQLQFDESMRYACTSNCNNHIIKPSSIFKTLGEVSISNPYDAQGRLSATGQDICDCFDLNCTGCWWLCPTCLNSLKCGLSCRCNRKVLPEELSNVAFSVYDPDDNVWGEGEGLFLNYN